MAAWKPGGEKHACFSPSGSRAAIFVCHARRTKRVTHDGLSERGATRSLIIHAQTRYSYFLADLRPKIFLSAFLNYSACVWVKYKGSDKELNYPIDITVRCLFCGTMYTCFSLNLIRTRMFYRRFVIQLRYAKRKYYDFQGNIKST